MLSSKMLVTIHKYNFVFKADTSILFSPIRFHTESGDDLPSLSLPSKKWKNNKHIAKRCHRVDMNTHKEIQKILRG